MAELLKVLPESLRSDFRSLKQSFTDIALGAGKINTWKGRRFETAFKGETMEYAYEHHEPRSGDVMIASFIKTGTTWTREIVRQILYGEDDKLDKITKDLTLPTIYIETGSPSKFNVLNNLPIPRRYYVTHLPPELLNMEKYLEKNIKMICMLRNPKDQMVSFYHHIQNFPYTGELAKFTPKDWNTLFSQEMEGKFPHNLREGETYLDYILSWLPYTKAENAMVVVYEEMIQTPKEHVKKIANFLGVDITDERAAEISLNCSLENMKAEAQNSKSEDRTFHREFKMLRKGEVGNWKNYFTVAQSEILDEKVNEKLGNTEVKFVYELKR